MNDLDLGYYKIKNEIDAESDIKEYRIPRTHPILKETGVSKVYLKDMSNVTLFSKNKSKILHADIELQNTYNINIYNLSFDELWEWDDTGNYDDNDWDYITINQADKVWIHSCNFGQSYDGTIDIKKGKNITISYCNIEPNADTKFLKAQFDYLEENMKLYDIYYKLRTEGNFTKEQIQQAFYYQYKSCNFGTQSDDEKNKEIRVTMHHNYFKNVKSRMPRFRSGKLHFYNNIINNTDVRNAEKEILKKSGYTMPRDSKGIVMTDKGQALVENCLFIEIEDFAKNYISEYENDDKKGIIKIKNCVKILDGKKEKIEQEEIGQMQDFDIEIK